LKELKELNELNEEKISGLPEVSTVSDEEKKRISCKRYSRGNHGTDRAGHHLQRKALVKDVNDLGCRFDTRAQTSMWRHCRR